MAKKATPPAIYVDSNREGPWYGIQGLSLGRNITYPPGKFDFPPNNPPSVAAVFHKLQEQYDAVDPKLWGAPDVMLSLHGVLVHIDRVGYVRNESGNIYFHIHRDVRDKVIEMVQREKASHDTDRFWAKREEARRAAGDEVDVHSPS